MGLLRRGCLAWLAIVLMGSGAINAQENGQSSQTDQSGKLSGHVYRSDTGEPIAKAVVILRPSDENPQGGQLDQQIALTDAKGAYGFTDIPVGSYEIRVMHSAFVALEHDEFGADFWSEIVDVSPGKNLEDINVWMAPAGVIAGSVTDSDHDPVKGVPVVALYRTFLPGGGQIARRSQFTTTDDLGNYRLSGLESGEYWVRAGGPVEEDESSEAGAAVQYGEVYYPAATSIDEAQSIQLGGGREQQGVNLSVRLELRTYSIRGTVSGRDPSADPRSSTLVELRPDSKLSSPDDPAIATAVVEPDGSFVVRGAAPGHYILTAEFTELGQPGSLSARRTTGFSSVHVEDRDISISVELSPPAHVHGTIRSAGNDSATVRGVFLLPAEPLNSPMLASVEAVDKTGAFDMNGVMPGRYFFSVEGPQAALTYFKRIECGGVDYTTRALEIEPGGISIDCKLTFARDTGTITGRVLTGQGPVQGFEVVAIPESKQLRSLPDRTVIAQSRKEDGSFEMLGLIPGNYLVFAVPDDLRASYYALDFADQNSASAQYLTIRPRQTATALLKPTLPK
jgi:hypothetical protein